MIKRKLFVVFSVFLSLCVNVAIKAQSSTAIVLNEYSASNIGTPVDNYGQQSDWVEIRNHHTAQVNLAGYYLSNDRNNLFKWKFPGGFLMGVETYSVVWLSGRNTVTNGNYHANFTLDQCKSQWLILSTSTGVIRDSIFVQRTKAGHSWGRVNPDARGIEAWRLYTSHSFLMPNPSTNNYRGYCPKPIIVVTPTQVAAPTTNTLINAGGFCEVGANLAYFTLPGPTTYSLAASPCFEMYYTIDGSYPVIGSVNTIQVIDSVATTVNIDKATIIRAIAVPNLTVAECFNDYLPSFCETNTYFSDPDYNTFSPDFGVLSIAIDPADTAFFSSNGLPANTPIHVEYYDKKKQVTEGYGIINRPPNESWKTAQKGYNITIDDKGGFGCNFEGNIFNVEGLGITTRTVFPTVHISGGDIESHSAPLGAGSFTSYGTGIRDVFLQSLAVKNNLNVNPMHSKPIIVFKNGKYDGVFTMQEVYDKYYEAYYHGQSKDSLDLAYYHNIDGYINYPDGSVSRFTPTSAFKTGVYDVVNTKPIGPGSTGPYYKALMNTLDKTSLMDYMILNSYALNSDLWSYNVAYARGNQATKPGNKWHYYLWNMPATFNFTAVATSNFVYTNTDFALCYVYSQPYTISPVQAGNSHGAIMRGLMGPSGNTEFQTDYKNRYQDLVNTALKCENVLAHFDYINKLYAKEMAFHEDPANVSPYATAPAIWDTNMAQLRRIINRRCYVVANAFSARDCYGLQGPWNILVNVEPVGAGTVKLNSILLDTYPWSGTYFQESAMSFKAAPTNTTYIFDHWEFKSNQVLNSRPLSSDSIAISFVQPDEVIAVFTDKSADVQAGVNVPTGFTPNGDGNNDVFKPLGSARFATEYEMTVWSRWGQEVFRSNSPDDGWDGRYNGQDAITGVYAYIIKYKNIYNEDKLLKGNITLTR